MTTKRFKSLAHSERADALRDEYRAAYALYADACEAQRAANNEAVALGDRSSRAFCDLKAAAGDRLRSSTMREAAPEAYDAWRAAVASSTEADAANTDARRLCEGLRYRARRYCAATFAQLVTDNAAWLDGQAAHHKAVRAFRDACAEFVGEGARLYVSGPRWSWDRPSCEAGVVWAGAPYDSDDGIEFDLGTDATGMFDIDASPRQFPDAGDVPTVEDVRRAVEAARTAREEANAAAEAYRAACEAREAALWPLRSVVTEVRRAESVQL